MFRGPSGILLAILVLAVVAMAAVWLDPADPALLGSGRASDGDSFRLNGERIRLLGIDAPELDQTCTGADGRDWGCGRVARDRLAVLLAGGSLDCQPDGHDQYRRILAVCQVKGEDIGRRMVGDGFAISSGSYWLDEQGARAKARGIWAGSFQTPRDWRDSKNRVPLWDWIRGLIQ